MNQPTSYPSRIQRDFEQMAYAYGVQPAVCTLLGEFFHQRLTESWRQGHRKGWAQAHEKYTRSATPAPINMEFEFTS